jgi:DNA-binding CsgD family transcriptional regulator
MLIRAVDKKQKEALVMALLEKGETYREITKKAGVSPNTIKAIANKAGLDESTSVHSRAFELFSEGKTPLQVAIILNLEAEIAIQYHQQYFMLLGCTEFTKSYLQVKENPWPFINLAKLVQSARIGEGEVAELLKIANGYLPRIRLEYDRIKEEIDWCKAEFNSWKAAVNNEVRVYQDFCDRNVALKKREDELQLNINELKAKEDEVQRTISGLKQQLSELREFNVDNNVDLEIKQEGVILMNDTLMPPSNIALNYYQNANEMHAQVEPSSRALIFDTKDLT